MRFLGIVFLPQYTDNCIYYFFIIIIAWFETRIVLFAQTYEFFVQLCLIQLIADVVVM